MLADVWLTRDYIHLATFRGLGNLPRNATDTPVPVLIRVRPMYILHGSTHCKEEVYGWKLISACSTSASARGEPIHFLYSPLPCLSPLFLFVSFWTRFVITGRGVQSEVSEWAQMQEKKVLDDRYLLFVYSIKNLGN